MLAFLQSPPSTSPSQSSRLIFRSAPSLELLADVSLPLPISPTSPPQIFSLYPSERSSSSTFGLCVSGNVVTRRLEFVSDDGEEESLSLSLTAGPELLSGVRSISGLHVAFGADGSDGGNVLLTSQGPSGSTLGITRYEHESLDVTDNQTFSFGQPSTLTSLSAFSTSSFIVGFSSGALQHFSPPSRSRPLATTTSPIRAIEVLSPREFLASSDDNIVRLWDTRVPRTAVAEFRSNVSSPFLLVRGNGNDDVVMVGSRTEDRVTILDVRSRRPIHSFDLFDGSESSTHSGLVHLAMLEDSQRLFTASRRDGSIVCCRMDHGHVISRFDAESDSSSISTLLSSTYLPRLAPTPQEEEEETVTDARAQIQAEEVRLQAMESQMSDVSERVASLESRLAGMEGALVQIKDLLIAKMMRKKRQESEQEHRNSQ